MQETKKRAFSAREVAYVALGTALMAVCAWISVPSVLSLVPFTLQTFAVCLAAALFGARLGVWSVVCYILLGLAGAPVFSGFRGGAAALLGPTGGYIAGFVLTAAVVGFAADRWGSRVLPLAGAMVLGVALCYAFGTAWFVYVYSRRSGPIGVAAALGMCVAPYLIPDGIKIALATVLAGRLRGLVKGRRKA